MPPNSKRRIFTRLMSNSVLSLAQDISSRSSQALVIIMVARTLGPGESGAFAIALSFQAILQTFTLTGIDYLLVREVSKNVQLAADYFIHMVALKVVLSIASFGAILLLLKFGFHYSTATDHLILLLALVVLPEGIGEATRALFLAFEWLTFPTAFAVAAGIAKVILSYWLLQGGLGIMYIALVVVGISALIAVANLLAVFANFVKLQWHFRLRFVRSLLPQAPSFAWIGLIRVFEYQSLILILSYTSGEHSVGIYNAAYILVLAALLVSQAYANGALPIMSRLHAESRFVELTTFYRRSIELILALALPVAALFASFAAALILRIYNSDYSETIPVMQMLTLTIPFSLFFAPQVCILLASNLQKWVVRILWVSFATNILMGLVLIPGLTSMGAAVARVVATAAVAGLAYTVVYVKVIRVNIPQLVTLPMTSTVIMVVAMWVFRDSGAGERFLSGVITYLAALIGMIATSQDHRRNVLQMLVSLRRARKK